MPQQIDDQQYYAIKACLERAFSEIQDAWSIMYGGKKAGAPTIKGAAPTLPNPGGKNYNAIPPTVTKDHQAEVDAVNPTVQSQKQAEEQISVANLKSAINSTVLVISASANGMGDYFALVQCNNTMQQASIRIEEDEYEQLQAVSADDDFEMELSQDQIDSAEWEPMRGTSTDPQAECNCAGNVSNANAYNDPKIEAEIAAGHTRKCRFWDYNTITYDQQVGSACQVELNKVDASATYGFDIYMNNRREILARVADPNDPVCLVQNDDNTEEFGIQLATQTPQQIFSHMVSDEEDDI